LEVLKVKYISLYAAPVLIIGIIFFLVRTLSIKIFSFSALDDLTHFIYLPAGIRLLAVAIYGWIGILGIMLGWFFCHIFAGEKTLLQGLCLGFVSGCTAYISLRVWQQFFRINNAFQGLTSQLAIYLVLISAVISALVRYFYLNHFDSLTPFLEVFLIGLTGDILGSFIILYCIKGILYLKRLFYFP
jgi:hypothetical protein